MDIKNIADSLRCVYIINCNYSVFFVVPNLDKMSELRVTDVLCAHQSNRADRHLIVLADKVRKVCN